MTNEEYELLVAIRLRAAVMYFNNFKRTNCNYSYCPNFVLSIINPTGSNTTYNPNKNLFECKESIGNLNFYLDIVIKNNTVISAIGVTDNSNHKFNTFGTLLDHYYKIEQHEKILNPKRLNNPIFDNEEQLEGIISLIVILYKNLKLLY